MKLFKKILLALFLALITQVHAREYMILSIAQNFPMHKKDVEKKKNYYVNLGSRQGISTGDILDITRTIAYMDPFDPQKRYTHKVKIGEVKVLHVEGESSITKLYKMAKGEELPYFEISEFMVGDEVSIHVK